MEHIRYDKHGTVSAILGLSGSKVSSDTHGTEVSDFFVIVARRAYSYRLQARSLYDIAGHAELSRFMRILCVDTLAA